jgi:diguanylate cyclase (GGDEF)-like protein
VSEHGEAAPIDPLTNLPITRLKSEQCLASLQSRLDDAERQSGWIVIDVDDLSAMNGYLTHRVSDLVLREVAVRLLSVVQTLGVVSRIGGDDFLVMLPHVGAIDDVQELATLILRAFDPPVEIGKDVLPLDPVTVYSTPFPGIGGHAVRVKVSMGLTTSKPGDDVKATLIKAEDAMFASKSRGKAQARAFGSEWTSI